MLLAISPAQSSSQRSSTDGAPPRPATSTAPSRREPCWPPGVHANGAASSQSMPHSARSWRQSARMSLQDGAGGVEGSAMSSAAGPNATSPALRGLPVTPASTPLDCSLGPSTHRSGVAPSMRTSACRCRQHCTALGCCRAKKGVDNSGPVFTPPSLISSKHSRPSSGLPWASTNLARSRGSGVRRDVRAKWHD